MNHWPPARLATAAGSAAYVIATAVILLNTGEPSEPWWWPGGLAFFLWCSSPFMGAILLRPSWGIAGGVLALAVAGQYLYTLGDALLFLFVPLYQWIGLGLVVVVLKALRRTRMEQSKET